MGVRDFAISTNHPFNIYRGGQQVRGKIHFKLDEPRKIRGVYVKLKGRAEVSWKERQPRSRTQSRRRPRVRTFGGNTRRDFITYSGEHEYFNEKIYLTGDENGEAFELPPGEYNYKFVYDLPIGIPSSFEGIYGNIRYKIKAGLDIPWGFDDNEEVSLQIQSPVDLNKTHLQRPANVSTDTQLCCWCCLSGELKMNVVLMKTGYAKGDSMAVTVDVENMSDTTVERILSTLIRKITFHAHEPSSNTKDHEDDICSLISRDVPAKSVITCEGFLKIPNDISCNIDNCSLIDVQYVLKVEAQISGCHTNLTTDIPITIGDVPLEPEKPQSGSIFEGLGTPYPMPYFT